MSDPGRDPALEQMFQVAHTPGLWRKDKANFSLDENVLLCAGCRKVLPPSEILRFKTWLTKRYKLAGQNDSDVVTDWLCKECRGRCQGMSWLVCLRCLEVVLRFDPWRDPKTGFEYRKDTAYHVPFCSVCADPSKGENLKHLRTVEYNIHRKHILNKKD